MPHNLNIPQCPTYYETSMLSALQSHTTEDQRKSYLRFICRNHLTLRNLITLYQTGYLTLQDFAERFIKIACPSLICLHTLLERNFNADEVEFRIFPKVDILYVRALRSLERLDMFEREEFDWGVPERHGR